MSLEKDIKDLLSELEALPPNRIAPDIVNPSRRLSLSIVSNDDFNAYSVVEIVIARLRLIKKNYNL